MLTMVKAPTAGLRLRRRRYCRKLEVTAKGVAVTETASDADMIALIKAHAREITGFVDEGMPAMMRGMGQ